MIAVRAVDSVVVVAYNNLIGGQDRLIFDGGGLIVSQTGQILAQGKLFEEDFIVADIDLDDVSVSKFSDPRHRKAVLEMKMNDIPMCHRITTESAVQRSTSKSVTLGPGELKSTADKDDEIVLSPKMRELGEIYDALTLGLRDYVWKNGFRKVVVGLSGGIDSAMVATIAADALGSGKCARCVRCPVPILPRGALTTRKLLLRVWASNITSFRSHRFMRLLSDNWLKRLKDDRLM